MLRPRASSLLVGVSLLASCSTPDTPLQIPIQFEHGFSVTHEFTTHRAKRYELIVAFQKETPIKPTGPDPDEFTVEFRLSSGGATVIEGTNDSNPRRPALLRRDYTARYLAVFPGQPGQTFQLFFHVVHAAPALVSTKPIVMISQKTYPPGEEKLSVSAASGLAADLANHRFYDRFRVRAPFQASAATAWFADGRWHWRCVVSYGGEKLLAEVSFTELGDDPVVQVNFIDSRR